MKAQPRLNTVTAEIMEQTQGNRAPRMRVKKGSYCDIFLSPGPSVLYKGLQGAIKFLVIASLFEVHVCSLSAKGLPLQISTQWGLKPWNKLKSRPGRGI